MADLKVRNLDDHVASMLKGRAKQKGISLEEEVRRTLCSSVDADREAFIRRAAAIRAAAGGKPGRPCTHPKKLYGDAGFDSAPTRSILRWLGIEPHIRHRNDKHGSHLGRVRWVVERTISWIKGLRRMRVRYDRSETTIDAWTSVAAAVVCLHILTEAIS